MNKLKFDKGKKMAQKQIKKMSGVLFLATMPLPRLYKLASIC